MTDLPFQQEYDGDGVVVSAEVHLDAAGVPNIIIAFGYGAGTVATAFAGEDIAAFDALWSAARDAVEAIRTKEAAS